jgi:hypothetical protein
MITERQYFITFYNKANENIHFMIEKLDKLGVFIGKNPFFYEKKIRRSALCEFLRKSVKNALLLLHQFMDLSPFNPNDFLVVQLNCVWKYRLLMIFLVHLNPKSGVTMRSDYKQPYLYCCQKFYSSKMARKNLALRKRRTWKSRKFCFLDEKK